jgi:hypothetical protein
MTGPAVHSFQVQPPPLQAAAGNQGLASNSSTEGQVSAALGTKWAHAVNVRLVLERRGESRVITVGAVTVPYFLCGMGFCDLHPMSLWLPLWVARLGQAIHCSCNWLFICMTDRHV